MCGITGFTWHDPALLKRMNATIAHRGPDQKGVYTDNHVSLGHQRLSIIDLSLNGKQPMCNEDETVWITFNGEIYNYLDLKPDLENKGHRFSSATDTEVIIHLYEEYGESFVQQLWGDYAFAIYDKKNKKLFLARDRIGVKPLYYSFNPNTKEFLFASEIKAILAHPPILRDINTTALRQYLTYRYTFGKNTIFNSINRVLPGECITFDLKTKQKHSRTYWDVPSDTIIQKSQTHYRKQFSTLYHDSVKRRLMSDVPLGVYLSGGIDSSSIVSMMHQLKQKNHTIGDIKTFSIGFNNTNDELPYSRLVSDYFSTDHHEFIIQSNAIKKLPAIIWHCDEPLADPALIPNYILSQNAKKHVTVVLTGDGGDETFAGYEQAKFMTFANTINKIPLAKTFASLALRTTPKLILDKFFKYSSRIGTCGIKRAEELLYAIHNNPARAYTAITGLFNDNEIKKIAGTRLATTPSPLHDLNQQFFPNTTHLLNKLLYFELKTLLPENMLMKSDKMSMAHAIETRVPLLDHRITELAFKMPPHLKLNRWNEKYILKKTFEKKLPPAITQRKKQRFYVPIDHWLKDDLMPVIDQLLSPQTINQQGYFTYETIKKIFDRYHHAPLFYARQLWTLTTFQIWHAIYIDKIKINNIL